MRLVLTLLLALSASQAAAQALVPRRAVPDEERLLYTSVPDIRLTTSIGAQIMLSELSR